MAELRWILLGLGLLLIAGIWWRGTRGSGQARENSGRLDVAGRPGATAGAADPPPAGDARAPAGPHAADPDAGFGEISAARDWGVPPFEPLAIKTTDFDRVPILDTPFVAETPAGSAPGGATGPVSATAPASAPEPMSAHASTAATVPVLHAADEVEAPRVEAPWAEAPRAEVPRAEVPRAEVPRAEAPRDAAASARKSERQKIVTLRICALGDARWSGQKLADALAMQGLVYGRYQIFHRNHVDGRSLFCVASLIEPGTFDFEAMAGQEFRGITAFAVLPGPLDAVQTVEAMIATARRLAEALTGMVQDGKGLPLSPQRAAALREEVARFQAGLA